MKIFDVNQFLFLPNKGSKFSRKTGPFSKRSNLLYKINSVFHFISLFHFIISFHYFISFNSIKKQTWMIQKNCCKVVFVRSHVNNFIEHRQRNCIELDKRLVLGLVF